MKRLILNSLPLLLLAIAATPIAQAQPSPEAALVRAETVERTVTPFDLVFLAYQGFLEPEGVPKFNRLITQYREGRLHAETLVQAAINMRRLSPEFLHDQRYLAAVEQQLNSLSSVNNH